MKTIIVNLLATLALVGVCLPFIWYDQIDFRLQIILSAILLVVIFACWFEWQPQESGKKSIKFWIWMFIFSITAAFLGSFIASVVYGVSYFGLLTFRPDAWAIVGRTYMLIFGGIFLQFIISLVSIIRGVILNLLVSGPKIENNPCHTTFISRKTLNWMYYVGDLVVLPPLFIIWGSAAWITFDILRLNRLRGFVLLLVWLPIVWLIASVLHKRGLVRLGISLGTTLLVVSASAWVILSVSK